MTINKGQNARKKLLEEALSERSQQKMKLKTYEQRQLFLHTNTDLSSEVPKAISQPQISAKQNTILTEANQNQDLQIDPISQAAKQGKPYTVTNSLTSRQAMSDWIIKYDNTKEVAFVLLKNLQTAFETSLSNGIIISAQSLTLTHEESLAIQFFSLIKCYDKSDPTNYKYLFNSDDITNFFKNYPYLEYAIIGNDHADKTTSIKKFISNCLTTSFAQTYHENNLQKKAYSFNINQKDPITNISKDADFYNMVINKTINHPNATADTKGIDYLLKDCQENQHSPYISADSCLLFDKDHPLHSLFFHYIAIDIDSNLTWQEPANFHISFTTLY